MKDCLVTYIDDSMKRKIYLIKSESTYILKDFSITNKKDGNNKICILHSTIKTKCIIRFVIEKSQNCGRTHIYGINNFRIVTLVTNLSLYSGDHLLFKNYSRKSIIFIFVTFSQGFQGNILLVKENSKYIVWK